MVLWLVLLAVTALTAVGLHFMELRTAPSALHVLFETYLRMRVRIRGDVAGAGFDERWLHHRWSGGQSSWRRSR